MTTNACQISIMFLMVWISYYLEELGIAVGTANILRWAGVRMRCLSAALAVPFLIAGHDATLLAVDGGSDAVISAHATRFSIAR